MRSRHANTVCLRDSRNQHYGTTPFRATDLGSSADCSIAASRWALLLNRMARRILGKIGVMKPMAAGRFQRKHFRHGAMATFTSDDATGHADEDFIVLVRSHDSICSPHLLSTCQLPASLLLLIKKCQIGPLLIQKEAFSAFIFAEFYLHNPDNQTIQLF